MTTYVARRIAQTVVVVLGVSVLSFGMMFLTGDPTMVMAGENWTRQQVDEFRHQMGFDRPWLEQYETFVTHAVRGDFGISIRQQQPVFQLIVQRIPATLELAGSAMAITVGVGIPLGMQAAMHRNTALDRGAMGLALLGQSMPVFWLGLLLVLVFSVWLGWFPVAGRGGLAHLVLPGLTLGLFSLAYTARITRSAMLDVLFTDYLRTARSKGLAERRVLVRHALRNALVPIITVLGLQFGGLLGGAVITETIFAWPGVGRLVLQAIQGKDLPLVQAAVFLLAVMFVTLNLCVDLLYVWVDPRVRFA
ncbi:MAG TPA: ABC transporter permease [bacterium]|nr:ABC transporter permease [bacterium]